jgi:hypothetical protein
MAPNVTCIACIVEGDGEVKAVPALIRRIAQHSGLWGVRVLPPIRVPKGKMVKREELTRVLKLAGDKLGGVGAILVLLDSDGDCPAELGPRMLRTASAVRPDLPIAVVVAHQEFEAWFLAAAQSLGGRRGLAQSLTPPSQPEAIRDAKGWLSCHMPSERPYRPTVDQVRLVDAMDLEAARSAPSFDKLYRDVTRLLGAGAPGQY